jgi:hypothetical protein
LELLICSAASWNAVVDDAYFDLLLYSATKTVGRNNQKCGILSAMESINFRAGKPHGNQWIHEASRSLIILLNGAWSKEGLAQDVSTPVV